MSYEDGQSYEQDGKIIPSLRAMIRANEYVRKLGATYLPYNLGQWYSEEAIAQHRPAYAPDV